MSESSEPAILLRDVGKMYKVFSSRFDNFADAIGFARLMPWRRKSYREFWALRDVNIEVDRGKRLGIIGCNGAGKTTLLKLITGNLPPTEGCVSVNGHVHALMSTGAGFHPEFTGRENIEASLIYQGLSPSEIRNAIEEIADFTELGNFLDQPFKTYSAGMQARLTFATATTLQPDILIVDEVLGAGDGYFIAKSTERITRLVKDTGATVLLVSHAMEQTVRFCDETIWLDRGHIVQRGPTLEVVKAYEQFLRVRNERRLRAKNKLRQRDDSGDRIGTADLGLFNNHVSIRFKVNGERDASCDIAMVTLRENGEVHEHVGVGDTQDSDTSRPAYVQFERDHAWSSPVMERDLHFRRIEFNDSRQDAAVGSVIFYLYGFFDDASYSAEITYRRTTSSDVLVEIWKDGKQIATHPLNGVANEWQTQELNIAAPADSARELVAAVAEIGGENAQNLERTTQPSRAVRRWPSSGTLLIRDVKVSDENLQDQVVFSPGQTMVIRIEVEAQQAGSYPVRASIVVFRLDGILVTRQVMLEARTLELDSGSTALFTLTLPELNLGPGNYVFSVAVFGQTITETDRYDLVDKAFEFEVVTREQCRHGAIFHHPSSWRIE